MLELFQETALGGVPHRTSPAGRHSSTFFLLDLPLPIALDMRPHVCWTCRNMSRGNARRESSSDEDVPVATAVQESDSDEPLATALRESDSDERATLTSLAHPTSVNQPAYWAVNQELKVVP